MKYALLFLACAVLCLGCGHQDHQPNVLVTPSVGEVKSGLNETKTSIAAAQASSKQISEHTAGIRSDAERLDAKSVVIAEWLKKQKAKP